MDRPDPGTITELLNEAGRGNLQAREELYRLVYEEMVKLAKGRLAKEPRLRGRKEPESLVNDVCLRFVGNQKAEWVGREQFYGYVWRAMWQICVEEIRKDRRRAKEYPFSDWIAEIEQDPGEIVAIYDALKKLEKLYPRQAEVVRMRFIEGRSVQETAAAVSMSDRTVEGDWAFARAWLHRELKGSESSMVG